MWSGESGFSVSVSSVLSLIVRSYGDVEIDATERSLGWLYLEPIFGGRGKREFGIHDSPVSEDHLGGGWGAEGQSDRFEHYFKLSLL
jgi:hypothetical protein